MKKEATLRTVSVIFSFIPFVICIFLLGQLVGFEQGAKWGNRPASAVMNDNVVLSIGVGPSAYDLFVQSYIVIVMCIVLYAVAKFKDSEPMTRFLAFIPLLVILYKYWQLLQWKQQYLELNSDFGYYYWIIHSIPFDRLCAVTTGILLISQIVFVIVSYRTINTNSETSF